MRRSGRLGSFLAVGAILAAGAAGRCASSPPSKSSSSTPAASPPATSAASSTDSARLVPVIRPGDLAGNWLFAIQMGNRTIEGSLHFTVVQGVLAGTWTSAEGREFELSKIVLDKDSITWESEGPNGRTLAAGKIDGASMKGTMKRVARAAGETGGTSGSGSTDSGTSGSGSAPANGDSSGSSGSRGGGRGRAGRGGRGRGGSRSGSITWTAYKSSVPPETPATAPSPAPTPGPV